MTLRQSQGAVALEFLLLFPFVVGILYASASYGVVFFERYEMQKVVDQAVQAALRVDRTEVENISESNNPFKAAAEAALPAIAAESGLEAGCDVSSGSNMLQCTFVRNNADYPLLPRLSFGFLGEFPPMPSQISATASVAY
ncbi:hypothetical protein FWJ25_09215 [Marinobacter salinexigens]|uniref:Pilus assembly protein TadE n=1 Tax=Marinobacter salinexigens TaxID=2919747 RepID=A0A5B0VID9_9GAMM|nr:TadE/TadG family type IV pilus assembly protein [Marinobacter salinexigens]KAA1174402.1 hypothetical protein FWJ25_09215 [Marinobacter salinexigens]